MSSFSTASSAVVIDANLGVKAVLPLGKGEEIGWIEHLRSSRTPIYAPDLWLAETTSAIRRMDYLEIITHEEGLTAVQDLFALGVQIMPSDKDICTSAYDWAARLGQSKAYDGLYLACAERLSADMGSPVEFWTADEGLANRARQLGARFVRQFGK